MSTDTLCIIKLLVPSKGIVVKQTKVNQKVITWKLIVIYAKKKIKGNRNV